MVHVRKRRLSSTRVDSLSDNSDGDFFNRAIKKNTKYIISGLSNFCQGSGICIIFLPLFEVYKKCNSASYGTTFTASHMLKFVLTHSSSYS